MGYEFLEIKLYFLPQQSRVLIMTIPLLLSLVSGLVGGRCEREGAGIQMSMIFFFFIPICLFVAFESMSNDFHSILF